MTRPLHAYATSARRLADLVPLGPAHETEYRAAALEAQQATLDAYDARTAS